MQTTMFAIREAQMHMKSNICNYGCRIVYKNKIFRDECPQHGNVLGCPVEHCEAATTTCDLPHVFEEYTSTSVGLARSILLSQNCYFTKRFASSCLRCAQHRNNMGGLMNRHIEPRRPETNDPPNAWINICCVAGIARLYQNPYPRTICFNPR